MAELKKLSEMMISRSWVLYSIMESNDRSVTVNLMITRSQVASIKKQTGIDGGIAIRQIGKIFKKGDYPAYPQNKLLMRQHGGSLGGLQTPKTLCSKLNGRDTRRSITSVLEILFHKTESCVYA
ncbi:hypothetical protein T4B_14258 [Trichinella pseudospiralis]|uniref:Uncharacterized protein n=1 Tax=Trichinella pseudospiralis TaxID=6337 RepID=A0A0V1JI76_TRIPS|nr:hypothetical protein T4A_11829 [Trichinella pseudospiralis]KRZ34689.1 hypothetical protein T4B_14258 [Trichinella pseudospiralis]KRZ46280.1 hypothetical protein T4C_6403 [Trichinella pseudospiralis]